MLALVLHAVHEHVALLVQPDRHETNDYGEPVPVRRAWNLLYDYELASEQVPA